MKVQIKIWFEDGTVTIESMEIDYEWSDEQIKEEIHSVYGEYPRRFTILKETAK